MRKFLYSPNFGGAWSFGQSTEIAKLYLFDEAIIAFIENGGEFTYENCHRRIVNNQENWPIFSRDDSTLHPLLVSLRDKILAVDPEEYANFGGADDLVVGTCPDGVRFRITEYDGNESFILDTTEQRWF